MSNDISFSCTLITQTFLVPLIFDNITTLFLFLFWGIFINGFLVIVTFLLKKSRLEDAFSLFPIGLND